MLITDEMSVDTSSKLINQDEYSRIPVFKARDNFLDLREKLGEARPIRNCIRYLYLPNVFFRY